jgi:hypothetical protein
MGFDANICIETLWKKAPSVTASQIDSQEKFSRAGSERQTLEVTRAETAPEKVFPQVSASEQSEQRRQIGQPLPDGA